MLEHYIREQIDVLNNWLIDRDQLVTFEKLVLECKDAISKKNTIYFFGNGGSASESNHLAAEFIGKCSSDSNPFPAISLSESSTILSAITNDYGFEYTISRQISALIGPGDVSIGLSTSGTSINVVKALELSKEKGALTSLWTSQKLSNSIKLKFVDFLIVAPTMSTPRAQELHLLLGHSMAQVIEIS
jgi:D-sedoheptulose 7-phosphate isomerase